MSQDEVQFGTDYITPAKAALFLQVHPRTIARWAGKKRLPYILTLGGQRRYRQKDIEDVARRMVAGGAGGSGQRFDRAGATGQIRAHPRGPAPTT
ncbi:MAG: helix-turn-helix domain-containing protein [Actinomycetota bacterium]|nr:helix-turn-helix domain-containing protein [Actinomycetota bacterium]MDQ6947478.1 helix-turn-helix domain-containing protein [Actinomycetota bacterium]